MPDALSCRTSLKSLHRLPSPINNQLGLRTLLWGAHVSSWRGIDESSDSTSDYESAKKPFTQSLGLQNVVDCVPAFLSLVPVLNEFLPTFRPLLLVVVLRFDEFLDSLREFVIFRGLLGDITQCRRP